jgi:hypothetical protein
MIQIQFLSTVKKSIFLFICDQKKFLQNGFRAFELLCNKLSSISMDTKTNCLQIKLNLLEKKTRDFKNLKN